MRFTDVSFISFGVRRPARYTKPGSSLITCASGGSASQASRMSAALVAPVAGRVRGSSRRLCDRPRHEDDQHDREHARRADEDRGEERQRRHDHREVVAVERGLEHEHERGHAPSTPRSPRRRRAGRRRRRGRAPVAPCARRRSRVPSASTSAATTRRSRLPSVEKSFRSWLTLRVARSGAAVVRDRLLPHAAESPRQRRREPDRDRGADRGARDDRRAGATTATSRPAARPGGSAASPRARRPSPRR